MKNSFGRSTKGAFAGALAVAFLLSGTIAAHATVINYTKFKLQTLVTNKIIYPTPNTCVSCKSGADSKIVNPAVYPSSLTTYVSNSFSNGLGKITAVGDAISAIQNPSLHVITLDANGSVSSTINSKSYEAITTQDSRFYGYFAGMGNVSLPITVSSKFFTTSMSTTYQDSLNVQLENLTTGTSTSLYKLQNWTQSGVFHTTVNFSTTVGDNYLLYTATGFEQMDYIYGAGSTSSFSQLVMGVPEPSTYVLVGTGLAVLVGLL